jgi:hypothetical protein
MRQMVHVIPKFDHGPGKIVLMAKYAQARGAQQEIPAGLGFQPQPTRGQYAKEVPARKNQDVSLDRTHAVNHAISPCPNVAG